MPSRPNPALPQPEPEDDPVLRQGREWFAEIRRKHGEDDREKRRVGGDSGGGWFCGDDGGGDGGD